MMHILISVAMIVVGVSIVRLSGRRGRRNLTQLTRLQADNNQLINQNNHLRRDRQSLSSRIEMLEENRRLDQLVAEDAVRRERRAKEALTAVLRKHHCTQEQIDRVLDSVDGVEIADL